MLVCCWLMIRHVHTGQREWCDQFWAGAGAPPLEHGSPSDTIVRHQLAACAGLYPALPQPLLTLLTALSGSAYSARSAATFLAGLQGISSFHPITVRPIIICWPTIETMWSEYVSLPQVLDLPVALCGTGAAAGDHSGGRRFSGARA